MQFNLHQKIIAAMLSGATLVSACGLLASSFLANAFVTDAMHAYAEKSAQESAARISRIVDAHLATAQGLSAALLGLHGTGTARRSDYMAIVREFARRTPNLIGFWTVWEPNALDGRDAEFINSEGHDRTGRFAPYWTNMNGDLQVEPCVDYDDPGKAGEYYWLPKQKRESGLTTPYVYPVRGRDTLMTSAIVPLIEDEQFLGVAGLDFDTSFLSGIVRSLKPVEGGYAALISADARYIVHPKMADDYAPVTDESELRTLNDVLSTGTVQSLTSFDRTTNTAALKIFFPISLGGFGNAWILEVVAPTDAILAPTQRLLWSILAASFAGLVIAFGFSHLMGRSISRPIVETVNHVLALARGQALTPMAKTTRKDEIGELMKATAQLSSAITAAERLGFLAELLPGAIFEYYADVTDFSSKGLRPLSYVSPSVQSIVGYSHDEILSKPELIARLGDSISIRRERITKAMKGDGYYSCRWDFEHRDGSIGTALERGHVAQMPDGQFRVIGVIVDDTQAATAARKLEGHRKQLAEVIAALDITAELIAVGHRTEKITYANKSFQVLCGFSAQDEYRGKDAWTHLTFPPGVDAAALEEEIMTGLMSEAGSYTKEADLVDPSTGEVRTFALRAYAIDKMRALFFLRDITEARHRDAEERRLRDQLAEAKQMEAIGNLAGGVAHDFNNFLAAIRNFSTLALDEVSPDTDAARFLARITLICDRATDVVREILTYARASKAEMEPLELAPIVDEASRIVLPTLQKNISLRVNSSSSQAIVLGSSHSLLQVIMNLLVNARDVFGDREGSVEVNIEDVRITASDLYRFTFGFHTLPSDSSPISQYVTGAAISEGDYVRVTVRDNGPGISPEIVEKIFRPFFTTKAKGKGTGFGLSVVTAVVTAHKGFVCLQTSLGTGTEFNTYLPVIKGEMARVRSTDQGALSLEGSERIMIVDDIVELADSTALSLEKLGYDCKVYYDPSMALQAFAADPTAWDAIITDQVMTGMKGIQLMEAAKCVKPDIDVIICTGFSDLLNESMAIGAGARAFFIKPVKPDTLAATIRHIKSKAS